MTRWLYEKHMINLPCADPKPEWVSQDTQMDSTAIGVTSTLHYHHIPTKQNQSRRKTHAHNL